MYKGRPLTIHRFITWDMSLTPSRQRVTSDAFVFGTAALTSTRHTKRLDRGVLQPCMEGCEISITGHISLPQISVYPWLASAAAAGSGCALPNLIVANEKA